MNPFDPLHAEPFGLTPEELAAAHQQLAAGEALPEQLETALTDDLLATQLLEATDPLAGIPWQYFGADGRLTDLGMAVTVEALRQQSVQQLHPAILSHLEWNPADTARMVDTAFRVTAALEQPQERQTPSSQQIQPRAWKITWKQWSAITAIAASVLIFIGIVFNFNNQPSTPENTVQASRYPQLHEAESNSVSPQVSENQELKLDTSATVADNFNLNGERQERRQISSGEDFGGNYPSLFQQPQELSSAETYRDEDASIRLPTTTTNRASGAALEDTHTEPAEEAEIQATSSHTAPNESAIEMADQAETIRARNRRDRASQQATPSAPGSTATAATSEASQRIAFESITRIYTRVPSNTRLAPVPVQLITSYRQGRITAVRFENTHYPLKYDEMKRELQAQQYDIQVPDAVIELLQNTAGLFSGIRLRWGGPNGQSIVFQWNERLINTLKSIQLTHTNNQAATMSAYQLLMAREYTGTIGWIPAIQDFPPDSNPVR
jgi:hypothetical protein